MHANYQTKRGWYPADACTRLTRSLQRVWLAWRWLLLAEADHGDGGDVDPAPLLLIIDQVRALKRAGVVAV